MTNHTLLPDDRAPNQLTDMRSRQISEALEVGIHQLFMFSHELESLTETEQDYKDICELVHSLNADDRSRLRKALYALYSE